MCKYSIYKVKQLNGQYSKHISSINKLLKMYDESTIRRMIKYQQIIILPCGHCKECLENKKASLTNKVKAQLKHNPYSYLITITLNNDQQCYLMNKNEKQYVLDHNDNVSPFTNLTKYHIENIIRNWKTKINKFYGFKVSFHYFLCGEYGSNTHRAHYHVLLMLDHALPYLDRQNVKGNHFKSKIIESKQFGLYDIQPTNNKMACSSYISKYLTKSQNKDKGNFNRFEEKQIKFLINNDYDIWNCFIWKSKELMIRDLVLYYLLLNDYDQHYKYLIDTLFLWRDKTKYKDITKQREFIKYSRRLGISFNAFENYNNKVLNNYYKNKYMVAWSFAFNQILHLMMFHNPLLAFVQEWDYTITYFIYLSLSYQLLFNMLAKRRIDNLTQHFKLNNVIINRDKYKKWKVKDVF